MDYPGWSDVDLPFDISMSLLYKLLYLDSVVRETLRMYSSHFFLSKMQDAKKTFLSD